MSFTFVNKNLLIPQIEICKDLNTSIQKLLDTSYNTDKTYCSNLYIVSADCIYFTNGKNLYTVSNTNLVERVDIKMPNKSQLKVLNSFLNSENNDNNDKNDKLVNDNDNNDNDNNDMNIKFNRKDSKTIKNDSAIKLNNKIPVKSELKIEPKEKSKEELELLKLCEETMEIYQNEVRKMKEIEQKIKLLENNKKSLLKKQKEKIFGNFSKFKNDYNAFKLINKKLDKKPDMNIPSLFALKYDYFSQLTKNEDNFLLLNLVDDLNLDEVLNKDCELDDKLQKFVNDYGEYSKKLNVKFDHSWEDLELETDAMEMNNSRLSAV